VRANEANATYRLVQKERELRFPFSITPEGEVQLTEELDREEKDMVRRTNHTTSTHSQEVTCTL